MRVLWLFTSSAGAGRQYQRPFQEGDGANEPCAQRRAVCRGKRFLVTFVATGKSDPPSRAEPMLQPTSIEVFVGKPRRPAKTPNGIAGASDI